MKINSDTTKAMLVKYAKESLGAELNPDNFKREELIAEVRKLEKELGIVSEGGENHDDNETLKEKEQVVESKSKNPKFAYVRIHQPSSINVDDDTEEETHCVIGFNGKNYQIEYDVVEGVKVPYGVYDIIKNAVQKRYRPGKKDKEGRRTLEERKEQRYPFTLVQFSDK